VRGTAFALRALAEAVLGETEHGRASARRARELSRTVETAYYSRFADMLADMSERAPDDVRLQARRLVRDTDETILDALVLAYRTHPPLAFTTRRRQFSE
jgi:hypothetical protein